MKKYNAVLGWILGYFAVLSPLYYNNLIFGFVQGIIGLLGAIIIYLIANQNNTKQEKSRI